MTNNNSTLETVDAQFEIKLNSQELYVHHFDSQGMVSWNKKAFAENIYVPATLNGKEACNMAEKAGRPLNGHFAIWLNENKDQIPEEWKSWKLLFMGTIISHASWIYMKTEPELTCLSLYWDCVRGQWKVEPINFSRSPLPENARIPMLPKANVGAQ